MPYQIEEYVDITWKKNIEQHILSSEVCLKACLGKAQITIGDLINLEKGDVIVLDKKIEEPLEVYIEDVPKILGKLGIFKNHIAIQIEKFLTLEEQ